jgi:hypothetical protein
MHCVTTLALAILGLVFLSEINPSWAQPYCVTSDDEGNTACGTNALYSNTEGEANSAFGDSALHSNTTGEFNTASGTSAL